MIQALALIFRRTLLKSTYQILSVHLDGKPLAENVQIKPCLPDIENLYYLDDEINIFDYPYSRRIISGSSLLISDIVTISNQIDLLNNVDEIIVKIDYYSSTLINIRLFLKRILQAIKQLQFMHSDVTYTIMVEESKLYQFILAYNQILNSSESISSSRLLCCK